MAFIDRLRKPPGNTDDNSAPESPRGAASESPAEPVVPEQPAAAHATGQARFEAVPEARFNLDDTSRLAELYEVPREGRDLSWLQNFQQAAWNASVVLPEQPVFLGPDGMPYVRLNLPPVGQEVQTNCLSNIFVSLAVQGLGAAFFKEAESGPETAEYVMPTGVLESLRAWGTWDGDPQDAAEMQAQAQKGPAEQAAAGERQVLVGAPGPDYLPKHTAQLLYRHLTEGWKMENPHVAVIVDEQMTPTRNLVLGRKFSEFPDQETAARATQMLLWYLPPRRHLLLMPENWTVEQLKPLKELC
jgi:hypothetical protein